MTKPVSQSKTYSAGVLPQDKYDKLDQYISTLEDKEGSLIHILHKAQEIFTFLPQEVQLHIARHLDIPAAKVFGVTTFYSYFTSTPVGKHTISLCMGTACFVRGAEKISHELKEKLDISSGGTTADNLFTLKEVRCIGACGLAPIIMIDDKVFGRVKVDDIDAILKEFKEEV